MSRIILVFLVGAASAGCAMTSPYVYRPEENATATMAGRAAADYSIPREAPRGDVRIASLGVEELRGEGIRPTRALRVRMIASNSTDAPWTLDTSRAQAWIGDERSSPALVVTSAPAPLPLVQIPRGEKYTIDLYYSLPARMRCEQDIRAFDLTWYIQTGTREVGERTTFVRERVAPPPDAFFTPYSYYDPLYGGPYFRR